MAPVVGSDGGVAAVDGQGDAYDEGRGGAAEPEHGSGHLLGGAEPIDGLVGFASARSRSPESIMRVTIGVSMVPGQMALMRTPRGAYSTAALRVRPMTPCLEAW